MFLCNYEKALVLTENVCIFQCFLSSLRIVEKKNNKILLAHFRNFCTSSNVYLKPTIISIGRFMK